MLTDPRTWSLDHDPQSLAPVLQMDLYRLFIQAFRLLRLGACPIQAHVLTQV